VSIGDDSDSKDRAAADPRRETQIRKGITVLDWSHSGYPRSFGTICGLPPETELRLFKRLTVDFRGSAASIMRP